MSRCEDEQIGTHNPGPAKNYRIFLMHVVSCFLFPAYLRQVLVPLVRSNAAQPQQNLNRQKVNEWTATHSLATNNWDDIRVTYSKSNFAPSKAPLELIHAFPTDGV